MAGVHAVPQWCSGELHEVQGLGHRGVLTEDFGVWLKLRGIHVVEDVPVGPPGRILRIHPGVVTREAMILCMLWRYTGI